MDYNAGFWTVNLEKYLESYKNDKIDFLAIKWKNDDNQEYYSLIASPCGYVVIEIMSNQIPEIYEYLFKKSETMRVSMKNRNNKPTSDYSDQYMIPMTIGRGTNRMDEVKKFYTSAIGVSLVYDQTYQDGS